MSTGNVGQVTSNTQRMNAGWLYKSEIFTAVEFVGIGSRLEVTRGWKDEEIGSCCATRIALLVLGD